MPPTRLPVSPKLPTVLANQAHIDLLGYDLFLNYEYCVLVIPAILDVHKFEEALSRLLQLYPHASGQIRCLDGRWFIELTNTTVPVDIDYKLDTVSDSLLDGDWVVQENIHPFISRQPDGANVINGDTPLLRFQLTFFDDNKTCVGACWHHSLGDGTIMFRCLHTLSQFYQGLSPEFGGPTFQKYNFPAPSLSVVAQYRSRMPYFHENRQISRIAYAQSPKNFDLLRWRFDHRDLEELRSALSSNRQNCAFISKQDCLVAYLVAVLNHNRNTLVRKVTNTISCRDVTTSFFDKNAASSLLVDVTADVPTDMAGIATALRSALMQGREPDYIYGWYTLKSDLMLQASNAGNAFPYFSNDDELLVISYTPMDWRTIHFGFPDGARLHATEMDKLFVTLFRSNPVKGDDGVWKDRQSIEISMGVPVGLKPNILETLSRGVRYMLSKERARL